MDSNNGYAIILQVTVFKDCDAILELFTEEKGKISVIAKGIRKHKSKNKGHCRIGSLVEYDIFPPKNNGSLGLLKKITTQKTCLSEDLKEQTRLMILCEVSSTFLSESQSESAIFELWSELLSSFPITEERMRGFLCLFFQKEGFFPIFKKKLESDIYWDSEYGITSESSLLSPQKKISLDILKVFHFSSHFPLSFSEKIKMSPSQAHEWWDIFWWFYSSHSDFFPRSKKIYENL